MWFYLLINVLLNHFTVGTKGILTCRCQSVCMFFAYVYCPSYEKTILSYVVVVALVLVKSFLIDTDTVLVEGEVLIVVHINYGTVKHNKLTVAAESVLACG